MNMTAHETTPSDAAIAKVVRAACASDLQFAGKVRPELQHIMDLSRMLTARAIEQGWGALPELPEPMFGRFDEDGVPCPGVAYTAEQMTAYGEACRRMGNRDE